MELKCWGMVTFALCLAALLSQVLGLNSRPLIKRQTSADDPFQSTLMKDLEGIKWSEYITGPQGQLLLPAGKIPVGFDSQRTYFLGFGYNKVFQECSTLSGERGRCRFLHHCTTTETLQSLDNFLKQACPIGDYWMGVCCAEEKTVTTEKPKVSEIETSISDDEDFFEGSGLY